MQKQYLLLRNNQQSGPYSLNELLQWNLKPSDLIWVEGKSHAWSHPSEIAELKAAVPAPAKPSPAPAQPAQRSPHIYVSLPKNDTTHREVTGDSLEARAEALRRKVETMAGREEPAPELNTLYSRTLDDVGESYGAWLTTKKKRGFQFHGGFLMPALLIAVVLVGGWWMGKIIFSSQTFTLSQQTVQPGPQKQNPHVSSRTMASPIVHTATPAATIETKDTTPASSPIVQKPRQLATIPQPETTMVEKPVEQIVLTETPAAPASSAKAEKAEEKKNESAPSSEPETNKAPEVKEGEKKKGIGKFFAGLFGKKKKEADETELTTVDLKSQVDVRIKDNPDHWMMGVKGAKVVVNNRSESEVKSATVEISYFSEEKDLLEKKVVQVGSVGKKKSRTIAVPDHRTAGSISCKLLSATGEEEQAAKQ
jgi:hypothetical protein